MLALTLASLLAVTAAQADGATPPPPPVKMRSQERLPSLVSGDTLGAGGSAANASAGFAFLGAAWAQGVTPTVDVGAAAEFELALTELFVGPTVRVAIAQRGSTSVALLGRAGFYASFGGDWVVSGNESNSGLQLSPGIAASTRTGAGAIATAAFELPITWTIRHGGTIVTPTARLYYEAPLYGDFTVGARLGASLRGASGGAPLADRDARFAVELGAVLTYRIF